MAAVSFSFHCHFPLVFAAQFHRNLVRLEREQTADYVASKIQEKNVKNALDIQECRKYIYGMKCTNVVTFNKRGSRCLIVPGENVKLYKDLLSNYELVIFIVEVPRILMLRR